jgi:hypothetical protein
MSAKKLISILLVVSALVWPSITLGGAITVESLLSEMIDLQRLTKLPDPPYTTKQFSSYDRKAKSPEEEWFANNDRGQYLSSEEKDGRKENVMMDVDGPGTIVRIWSANPDSTLRIYIDGSDKPTLEGPFKEFLGGKFPGFPSPLAGERGRGWNLYFPIPYAKHCKVTIENQNGYHPYYHINYRTYPSKTEVTSFKKEDLERLSTAITRIADKLRSPKMVGEPPEQGTKGEFDLDIKPGEERALRDLAGPMAVTGIWAVVQADDMPTTTRGLLLSMTFDEEETVHCPFGDFFGMAPGFIPYEALPIGVADKPSVYPWSHWWMPFKDRIRITVKNFTEKKVHLHGVIDLAEYKWDDNSLLFHAKWRIERDIPSRPQSDWSHLQVTGAGRFVGGALQIINPAKNWWGEGDEKIYVDGEKFPSHFGTGSEDYYGYAWGSPERFVHAYHNQPKVDGPANYGSTSVNRFHIFDDIPFTKDFKFDMENWALPDKIKTTRSAVSYWYARPGSKDSFKTLTKEDLKYVPPPAYEVYRVKGVIEGELLTPSEKTAGEHVRHGLNEKFSGEEMLRWTGIKVGAKLTIPFEAAEEGKHHVIVHLAKAAEYVQVQLSVNGKKAGEVIDTYSAKLEPSGEIDLGEFELKKGANNLGVEVVGKNAENKSERLQFGLDYIRLK